MQEQKQGETYEEVNEEQAEASSESSESTSAPGLLFNVPIKFVAIGAAVILILIVAIFVISSRKSDSDDEIITPDDSFVEDDVGSSLSEINVCDDSGTVIGFCYSTAEGETIINSNYVVIGYISASGSTPFFSESGEQLGMYNPEVVDPNQQTQSTVSDVPEQPSNDVPVSVESDNTTADTEVNLNGESDVNVEDLINSTERNKLLRQYGYTGDEIELADKFNLSTSDLVNSARKLRDKAAAESMIRMSKKSSKEFRTMKENSIFCMGKITFEIADLTRDDAQQYDGSYVVNADYSKCPTYGHQLFIKCKIANSFYAFMSVSPSRWNTLPDNGNIVVKVDYLVTGNANANMYITNITEVDTTELTVNPQDSGVNINDVLSNNASFTKEISDESQDITEGGTTW